MSDPLQAHLLAALGKAPAAPLCVAFSGGPDSSALLHALAHLPQARARGGPGPSSPQDSKVRKCIRNR